MFTYISTLELLCATNTHKWYSILFCMQQIEGVQYHSNKLSDFEKVVRNIAMGFNTKKIYGMGSHLEVVQ